MRKTAGPFVVLFLALSQLLLAQGKGEMPFSGSSPEMNKKLREAWMIMGEAKMADGRDMLRQLREADPQFALACLFSDADNAKEKQLVTNALGLRASIDEKAILQARLANLEKNPTGKYLEPLVKKYPNDKQLLTHIAWMMGHKEDANRSIEILNMVIKKNPDFALAYNLRGYRYMGQNMMDKAGADFDKYISLRPDLANVYDSKADYLMRAGKTEEAIPLYEKAVSMDSKMVSSRIKAENAKNKAYGYKVPERTIAQKHARAVFLGNSGFLVGLSYAKKAGQTAADYGTFCGNLYKTGWNKAAGFEGFVRGALLNFEALRRDNDPPIEIVSQTLDRVVFKWKINFRGLFEGDSYGVTFEEFNNWFTVANSTIAEYLGGTYTAEVQADDWLMVTLARKPDAQGTQ